MPIDNSDFESLTEADLNELITGQVPESLYIEYKRETYGASDADKREALKWVFWPNLITHSGTFRSPNLVLTDH